MAGELRKADLIPPDDLSIEEDMLIVAWKL